MDFGNENEGHACSEFVAKRSSKNIESEVEVPALNRHGSSLAKPILRTSQSSTSIGSEEKKV